MKKVLKNKLYDTSTARLVGQWSHGSGNSLKSEHLYRKRTGEFFLHGQGGPRYAAGEAILPLSWDAARQWAKEHLEAGEFEALFGEIVEDGSRITICLSLHASSLDKAKRAAAQKGMSLSAYIESCI